MYTLGARWTLTVVKNYIRVEDCISQSLEFVAEMKIENRGTNIFCGKALTNILFFL